MASSYLASVAKIEKELKQKNKSPKNILHLKGFLLSPTTGLEEQTAAKVVKLNLGVLIITNL